MGRYVALKRHQVLQFLVYAARAKSIHTIHPPFAFDLYTHVLKQDMPAVEKKIIQSIRKKGLRNRNVIEHTDMGAGSGRKEYVRKFKRVSDIVKDTAIKDKYGKVLFHLVKHFQPAHILEFGTATGISTLFLALARQNDAQLITMEGCSETATVARSNFKKANIKDIDLLTGSFDSVLPIAIEKMPLIDLAYIDGNHVKEATINYFNSLLDYLHNDSILVFDDIHWSSEMTQAWETIRKDTRVSLSIDLFKMGLVFFKKELSKQHMILRY